MSLYKLDYTGEQINTNISKFFNSLNTVIVSAPIGSDIKMIKGLNILTAVEENNKWVFHPDEFGTWSIVASNSNLSADVDIIIDSIKIYEATIIYS